MALKARFPGGRGLYFVCGLLWGWMGLAQLLDFFPRWGDKTPQARSVRLSTGLAMVGVCALYLGGTFLPASRRPLLLLAVLLLIAAIVFVCLSHWKTNHRKE